MRRISVLDTTLRDGEQTRGVSFSSAEKLHLAKELLSRLNVDRIEVASCKVGGSERDSLCAIMGWADANGFGNAVEVLSFVDGGQSLDWLDGTGCRRINLLAKGSRAHCEGQLGKSDAEHQRDIADSVADARRRNMTVSVYLEDWSRGIQTDESYVRSMLSFLSGLEIERVYLCDTLGVLSPVQVSGYVGLCCSEFPDLVFEFHGHNDYGLATANVMAAVEAGAQGIHVTVNGLGERAGNAVLAEAVVSLADFGIAETGIREDSLIDISTLCAVYSQKIVPDNAPITGKNVFTHVSGIHVDGQEKAGLYQGKLLPQRFGKTWEYGLGKLSGRKAMEAHLRVLDAGDLSLDAQKQLLDKIREMNEHSKDISPSDLKTLIERMKP